MRLLMTRPEPDASLSAERLRTLGHDVLISPVMTVNFSNKSLSWQPGTDLVVTSRNGVRALAKHAHDEMRESALLYTVGDATAALAREAGFLNILSASGSVDDLIDLIAGKKPAKLLYICGRERKEKLETKLNEIGITLDLAESYHADFAKEFTQQAQKALQDQTIDGILLYSNRSAEALKKLMNNKLVSQVTNDMTYFCLAKDISYVLDSIIGIKVVIADHPNEQSLCDAVQAYAKDCSI